MTDRYAIYRADAPCGPYVVTSTLIAVLDQLQRLSWPVWVQEQYTREHYGTEVLGALSEAQARAFLAHLHAAPTANPQWPAEAHP